MKVFIHTNHKQMLGAYVAKYCVERNTANRDKFTVGLIRLEDYPHLMAKQGQKYRRKGIEVAWANEDLHSFTPLRFLPPQLMGHKGRAVVIDPDVFALGDIYDLLTMDMQGKAILCRYIEGTGTRPGYYASSVMLLDCTKLKHWKWEEGIDEMFTGKRDYRDWVSLYLEDSETIGPLGEEWNSFDKLTDQTKLLHNTGRITQPWKTGLAIDFSTIEKQPPPRTLPPKWGFVPRSWIRAAKGRLGLARPAASADKGPKVYRPHPDQKQVDFFFSMLAECVANSKISRDFIMSEVGNGHLRSDACELVDSKGRSILGVLGNSTVKTLGKDVVLSKAD